MKDKASTSILLEFLANSASLQRSTFPWLPCCRRAERSLTVGSYVVSDGSAGRPFMGSEAGLILLYMLVMLDRSLSLGLG